MKAGSYSPTQLAGHSILVVEDEYFLADDVAAALGDIGAKIIGPIGDLAEAMRAVSENAPAGAALDVNIRGRSVYPLAKELESRGIPFIFMTGYAHDAIPSEYQHIPRCEKPFDVTVLASKLAALVLSRRKKGH
jgi:DNA-binding NtrC family response regulator